MQQQTGVTPAATAVAQASGTGPVAEASTHVHKLPQAAEAIVTLRVTHSEVTITAALNMGGHAGVVQRWKRRRGRGAGWRRVEGPTVFAGVGQRISPELANLVDRLPFPFELANMLPKPATAAAAIAIAAAEQEVAHA